MSQKTDEKTGPKHTFFSARPSRGGENSLTTTTTSNASTQNRVMEDNTLPFFMQPNGNGENGVAGPAAVENGVDGPAPAANGVVGRPVPEVIAILDDDEDDVAIQAGINNHLVHRTQSNASLASNQSSASAASSSKSSFKRGGKSASQTSSTKNGSCSKSNLKAISKVTKGKGVDPDNVSTLTVLL